MAGQNPFPFVLVDGLLNGGGPGGGGGGGMESMFFGPFPGGQGHHQGHHGQFHPFFGAAGAGGQRRPRGPQPDNSGVGHLYDSQVPIREWIRQEQARGGDDEGGAGAGNASNNNDGSSAAELSAEARDRGNQCYGRGQLDAALAHYTESLRHLKCEKAYANRSLVHHTQGNFHAAADDARSAVAMAPDYYRGHVRLANALFSLGQYDEGAAAAEEAARLAPNDEEREKCFIVKVKCEAKQQRRFVLVPTPPVSPNPLVAGGGGGGTPAFGCQGGSAGTPQFPSTFPSATTPLDPSAVHAASFGGSVEALDHLVADLSPLKKRRLQLRQEMEKSDLVSVADRFTRTQCAKEVKNLLNEVDPELLAAAQYAASTSQEQLRAAAEAGDRVVYEQALQVRDTALDAVWQKAKKGVKAVGRVHKLATEENEAICALKKAIADIDIPAPLLEVVGDDDDDSSSPPPTGSKQSTDVATAGGGGMGERTNTTASPGPDGPSLQELGDLVAKHRTLRTKLHEELHPAMTKVDQALLQLANAKEEEDASFDKAGDLFAELKEVTDGISGILSSLKNTTSCAVVNKQRLETLDQLMPTFESLLHDKEQFQKQVVEGNNLLEEEAHLERDRLKWEKQRIQCQAALEWSKVKEDLPSKIEHSQKEVDQAIDRIRTIVQRQADVRGRLRDLMAKDHPELAWKAAAAGSQMMKTVKGTGLWVNESFSDFQIHSVVSAPANNAKVYRATSRIRGTDVALKEIPIETERDKKHFLTEVGVSVAASHSSVCPVLGVFFDGPFGYIIMPFFPLGNVQKCLQKSESQWPWWKVQEVFRQIVSGVAHLHSSGVMHHDLKPSNVLMKSEGTALLADFGLSRDLGQFGRKHDVTVTSVRGTPDYTPPELLAASEGDQVSAIKADMWSLGATLYTLASQNVLKDDSGTRDTPPTIGQLQGSEGKVCVCPSWVGGSERLADLLTMLLDCDPEKRPLTQTVLAHPYFTVSLLKDLVDNHQLIESNSKLEAFRTFVHEVNSRATRREPTMMSVVRARMVESITSILGQVVNRGARESSAAAQAGGGNNIDESGRVRDGAGDALLSPFFVVFRGEEGIDEGGLSSDMFTTYFEQLATTAKALVHAGSPSSASDDEENAAPSAGGAAGGGLCVNAHYLPSADPKISPAVYKTMGMMMLKSLVDNRPLPMQLSTAVLKFLVGGQPTLTDLEEYDKVMVRNLRRLLLMGAEELEGMCLDFTEFDSEFLVKFEEGAIRQEDEVTRDNVASYVHAKVQYELIGKRLPALNAIKEGFYTSRTLQPHLQLLSATELQLLLCGQQHVNAEDVVALLDFSQFPRGSQTPAHLKELLRGFSQSNLRRFLRLCTSSVTVPRTPPQGPVGQHGENNRNRNQPVRIKILCTRDTGRLPVGHSCAYQLDLPDYNSMPVLKDKLGIALAHANDGFNIV